MKALSLEPELLVEDMSMTLDFYINILGFELELSFPEVNPSFARIKRDNIKIMLNHRSSFEKEIPDYEKLKMGGTTQIFIKINGIKDFYEKIKNKIKIVQPLHETNYGSTEFIIVDCNGYFIDFSEEI